jgi:hypothetical protein
MHFKDDTWYVFHLEAGVSLVTRDVGFDDVTQTFTLINSKWAGRDHPNAFGLGDLRRDTREHR